MMVSQKFGAAALSASLLFGGSGLALAQTPSNNNTPAAAAHSTPQPSASGSSATNGSGSSMNSAGRDTGDRHFDWGWLGLVGLVGLFGLTKKDRSYRENTGRVSTAAR